MALADILTPDVVKVSLDAREKTDVIRELVQVSASFYLGSEPFDLSFVWYHHHPPPLSPT